MLPWLKTRTNKLLRTRMRKIQTKKTRRMRRQNLLMMKKKLTKMMQTRLTRALFRNKRMRQLWMSEERSFTSNTTTSRSVKPRICPIHTKMMSHLCSRLIPNRNQSASEKSFSRRKTSKAPKFFSLSRLKTKQLEYPLKVDPRAKMSIPCSGFLSRRKILKLQ